MSDVMDTTGQPAAEEKPSRGCLYGCLAVGALILGTFICGGFAIYFFIAGQVKNYTAETPMELPSVEYSSEQLEELHARIDTVKNAVEEAAPSEDLVLTAEEINALINEEEKMKGRAHVDIKDGLVVGDISFPTDGIPGGKGRYFNASADFDVKLERGVLIVTLANAEVKGKPVPDEFMEAMRQENLAKDLYKDPKNAEMISRFESIEIVDDKIILKLKRDEEDDAAESGDESAEDATAAESGEDSTAGEDGAVSEATDEAGAEDSGDASGSEDSGETAAEDSSAEEDSGDEDSGDEDAGDASGSEDSGETAEAELSAV